MLRRMAEVPVGDVARALAQDGLWIDLGVATVRVQSDSTLFAAQLQRVYSHFPFAPQGTWADAHLQIVRASGARRWLRPQVVMRCDGQEPFEPFDADGPLPLFEWSCNWLLAQRLNNLLLLHAGAVERDGLALVLPALPGSGKSTLTAALAHRGWRLMSDEFGALDPEALLFRPLLKPAALKNQSIQVIRNFAPEALLGPSFPKTRKGTVAHVGAPPDAVDRRHQSARPGAFVLPRWQEGSATFWQPVAEHVLFPALSFHAFNYDVLGASGFSAAVRMAQACPAWQLVYSDLNEAVACIDAAWPEVLAHHGAVVS